MRAEIIAVGTELTDGRRAECNSGWIAAKLTALGATVSGTMTVPDDPELMEAAISRALATADLVIVTGGLGPTADDRTRQVVARALGASLELHDDALSQIRERFERRGMQMPESNATQAMMPVGAHPIENRVGVAPGFRIEAGAALLFVLPGVPAEMKAMVLHYVAPFLEGRGLVKLTEERLIRTTGLPESVLADRVGDMARRLARVEVAYLPSITGVDLRIVGRGETRVLAARAAERAQERLATALGSCVYARGDETIEQVVGYLLTMNESTVAAAESCTAGRVSWAITRVPGSSGYFVGGIVAYSNDLKKRLLKVKAGLLKTHGAVSAETAEAMAENVRSRCRADYGLSVTGIAGPGGGTEEKPVGLVYVAIADDRGTAAVRFIFPGARDAVRRRATHAALDVLRRRLLELPLDGDGDLESATGV